MKLVGCGRSETKNKTKNLAEISTCSRSAHQDSAVARKSVPKLQAQFLIQMNTVERRFMGSAKTKVDAQFELVFAAEVAHMEHQSNVRCCRQDTTEDQISQLKSELVSHRHGRCSSSLDSGRCRHVSQSIPRHFTDCFARRRLPPIFFVAHWVFPQEAQSSELLVLVRYPTLHHVPKELG